MSSLSFSGANALAWNGLPQTGPPVGPCRLGFLISDEAGPCLAVQEAIEAGALPGCTIALVICNITGAPGTEAARAAGLRAVTLEGRGHEQREHEEAIDALLRRMEVDVLCLSGYLRLLSQEFIRGWPGRLLTGHASLLPAFPGARPERQALDYGAQITGYTISLLEETADLSRGGPVVVQRAILVAENDTEDTLKRRLAPEEDDAWVEAIRRVASREYVLEERHFVRRPSAMLPNTAEKEVSAAPEAGSNTAEIQVPESATKT